MKLAVLILPVLASATTRPPPPQYDCSEQRSVMQPVYQSFRAEEDYAYWHVHFGDRIDLSIIASPTDDQARRALLAGGILEQAAAATLSIAKWDRDTTAVSADVRAGNRALPLQPLIRGRDGYHAASVPAALLSSLIAEGGDLLVVLRDRQGRAVSQGTLPITMIRDALPELVAMFARVRENMTDPPHRCAQVMTIVG